MIRAPVFLVIAALGFDYVAEEDALKPVAFLRFLDEIFAGDDREEQIESLQEIFGYLLTGGHVAGNGLPVAGAKRSGKGTILGTLQKLIAPSAVTGPTLKSLGTNFSLTPLIGKQLAIIDDLRVGSPKDRDVLTENVLKITGRGLFTIDRQFKSSWTGTLPIKLVLVSNLMSKLGVQLGGPRKSLCRSCHARVVLRTGRPQATGRKNCTRAGGIFHWALKDCNVCSRAAD